MGKETLRSGKYLDYVGNSHVPAWGSAVIPDMETINTLV